MGILNSKMKPKATVLSAALVLSSFIVYGQGVLPIVGEHPTDTISVQNFTDAKNIFGRSDQFKVVTYVVSFIDGDSLVELRVDNDSIGAEAISSIRANNGNVSYRKTYVENIEIKDCKGNLHKAPSRVLMIAYPKKD